MSDTWILYKTTNLINGKVYIGVHKLANTSKSKCYLGSGNALQLALQKYGRANFTRITLAEFNCGTDAYLAEAEMVTEEFVERRDNYNMKKGGRGGMSAIPTEETRAKISAIHKGKKHSPETIAKMSQAHKGKIRSAEHSAKISASKMGTVKSKETLEKISGKNNWRSMAVVINGNYYESGRLAAKTMNIFSCVVSNRVKSTNPKWLEWRYATLEEKLSHA